MVVVVEDVMKSEVVVLDVMIEVSTTVSVSLGKKDGNVSTTAT